MSLPSLCACLVFSLCVAAVAFICNICLCHVSHALCLCRYGKRDVVEERHRHRYEVEPALVPDLEKHGFVFVGRAVVDSRGGGTDTVAVAAEVRGVLLLFCRRFHSL